MRYEQKFWPVVAECAIIGLILLAIFGAVKCNADTLTFYHHSVGTCYLDNGLADVARAHGYTFVDEHFPPENNCPCDLRDWFAANPAEMTGAVLVKSCFYCANY